MTTAILEYSFKVWLTTVILAPAVIIIAYVVFAILTHGGAATHSDTLYDNIVSVFSIYALLTLAHLICSLFTLALFMLLNWIIACFKLAPVLTKWLICFTGIILTTGTILGFVLIFCIRISDEPTILFAACNSICIGAATWYYKLDISDELISNQPQDI